MLLENDYLYEDKTGLENLKIFGVVFWILRKGL